MTQGTKSRNRGNHAREEYGQVKWTRSKLRMSSGCSLRTVSITGPDAIVASTQGLKRAIDLAIVPVTQWTESGTSKTRNFFSSLCNEANSYVADSNQKEPVSLNIFES